MSIFKLWSNLSFYQLKTECYKLLHVSLLISTKQKRLVNTQKIMRKELKYNIKLSNHKGGQLEKK